MNIHRLFSRGCCLFKSQGDTRRIANVVIRDNLLEEEGTNVGYTIQDNTYLWVVYRVDDILSCAAYFGGRFTTNLYSQYHRDSVDTLLCENCPTLQTLEFTTVPDTGEDYYTDYTEEFLELEL